MSVENYNIPRFKVLANYPGSPYPANVIIKQNDGTNSILLTISKSMSAFSDEMEDVYNYCHPNTLSDYPALFKPVEWWEFRTEKDMPEYVKMIQGGEVVKAERWDVVEGRGAACLSKGFWLYTPSILPATKEEFESQPK
jgi:hypothetical protein